MLVVANTLLDAEAGVKTGEREKFLEDKCPPLDIPYSKDELVVRENRTDPSVRDKLLAELLLGSGVRL